MKDRKEVVEHYRHLISSRYKLYGWMAGLIWAIGLMLYILIGTDDYYRSLLSGMQVFGLLLLWYIFNHRYRMLFHFNLRFDDPLQRLEHYYETKQKRWNDFALTRIGSMLILGIGMVFLLVFDKDNVWTGISISLFLSLTVALMIKGWLDFGDTIVLHDIQRSLRD